MRNTIQAASTTALAACVAAIDVLLWSTVIPFEMLAHRIVTAHHPSSLALIGILAVNAIFLGLMFAAGTLSVELVRRGVTFKRLFFRYSAGRSADRSGPIQTDCTFTNS